MLASALGLDICILSLTERGVDDDQLRSLLAVVPERSLLLLEDVDCVCRGRDVEGDVSFSGLLNALDGVCASEGRILVMTTNHPEQLDPALGRPGRVDLEVEVPHADTEQAARMFKTYFPDAVDELCAAFTAMAADMSMAELQSFLMRYDNPVEAIENVRNLAA
jgi:mitochondrial chaperone BCS1